MRCLSFLHEYGSRFHRFKGEQIRRIGKFSFDLTGVNSPRRMKLEKVNYRRKQKTPASRSFSIAM